MEGLKFRCDVRIPVDYPVYEFTVVADSPDEAKTKALELFKEKVKDIVEVEIVGVDISS